MQERVWGWLADHGIASAESLAPVKPGLGDTTLWKISRSGSDEDLLIRIFPAGASDAASRELIAMRTAARHGVPVPEILLLDELDARPVLITTWCPGEPALQVLQRSPGDARRIGVSMGEALGRLHRVTAPETVSTQGRSLQAGRWISRGGAALATGPTRGRSLRSQLERVPNADRLLHLDYHPDNVLIVDGRVSAIIDWANALPGPPHMDVARSRALVQAVRVGEVFPAAFGEALDRFEEGLAEGHASVIGPNPHPELSAAWGMAMTVDDLTDQVGKPESWVTSAVLDRLKEERDRLIQAATVGVR